MTLRSVGYAESEQGKSVLTIEQARQLIGKTVRSTFRLDNAHCPLPAGTQWRIESVAEGDTPSIQVYPLHRFYEHLDAPMEFTANDFVSEEEWTNHPLRRRTQRSTDDPQTARDLRALFGTVSSVIRCPHEIIRSIGFVFDCTREDGRQVPVHVRIDGFRDLRSGQYGSAIRLTDTSAGTVWLFIDDEGCQRSVEKALRSGVVRALAAVTESDIRRWSALEQPWTKLTEPVSEPLTGAAPPSEAAGQPASPSSTRRRGISRKAP